MSFRRIGVLLHKELVHGSQGFFFLFAILGPLLFTLLVNLVFGSLFAGKPDLGIVDLGRSEMVQSLIQLESVDVKIYNSETELKQAVRTGGRDIGVILSSDFDKRIKSGESLKITAYVWGESLLKDRAMITAAFLQQLRRMTGTEAPVEVIPVPLGEKESVPWKDRFLPLIILMAIFISGFAIPSSSIVDEKQRKTIGAVITTPATQLDLFIAKGLLGVIMSMIMSTAILFLNNAAGSQLGLVLLIMFMGAVMASCFGVMMGAFMKELSSLYSAIKGLNLLIYAPGIVQLFPKVPPWIGKIFPTYYVINPIMALSRRDGSWATIRNEIIVLFGIIILLIFIVVLIAGKTNQQEG